MRSESPGISAPTAKSDLSAAAVTARGLRHRYGERSALDGVDFDVPRGAVHGFLGPNGSGKSTLFKLLATLLPLQSGSATVLGLDLATGLAAIRRKIGVVFQSPALDRKLTVRENLRYGGHLQGLRGALLEQRIDAVLEIAALRERSRERVAELSGGLRRRVEIAKGLLHEPELVLLDEPSTGLDPTARHELWRFLRARPDLTVLFTTHLMNEAADADRLTVLDAGKVVARGTPDELRAALGGDVLEIEAADPGVLAPAIAVELGLPAKVLGRVVRIESARAHELVTRIVERFGDRVLRISVAKPSLEDVFIQATGRRLGAEED